MHESSVTEAMLGQVLQRAKAMGAARICRIALVVGEHSGYGGDSIQFYFDRYALGTIAEGAKLEFTYVQPKMRCTVCDALFVRKPFSFTCPSCGGEGRATKIGTEFYIDTMDIEYGAEEKP